MREPGCEQADVNTRLDRQVGVFRRMSSRDPLVAGEANPNAFAALSNLFSRGSDGKAGSPSKAGAGVELQISSAGAAGVCLTIVSCKGAPTPAAPAPAPAAPAPAPAAPTPAPPAPTPAPAAPAPAGVSSDDSEDPATNAKLLAVLASSLGEPTGRWSTSSHEAVRTSEEAAQVRGATLASGAKAMLLSTKSDAFVLAVISASESMDSKAFKKAGGFKSTKFATPEEVFSLTGCRPGAVPPFGSLWGVRTFVDSSLVEQGDSINFNSGLKTCSVRMSTQDYLDVEKPTVASFRR